MLHSNVFTPRCLKTLESIEFNELRYIWNILVHYKIYRMKIKIGSHWKKLKYFMKSLPILLLMNVQMGYAELIQRLGELCLSVPHLDTSQWLLKFEMSSSCANDRNKLIVDLFLAVLQLYTHLKIITEQKRWVKRAILVHYFCHTFVLQCSLENTTSSSFTRMK